MLVSCHSCHHIVSFICIQLHRFVFSSTGCRLLQNDTSSPKCYLFDESGLLTTSFTFYVSAFYSLPYTHTRTRTHTHTHTHAHAHVYIYIFICACARAHTHKPTRQALFIRWLRPIDHSLSSSSHFSSLFLNPQTYTPFVPLLFSLSIWLTSFIAALSIIRTHFRIKTATSHRSITCLWVRRSPNWH